MYEKFEQLLKSRGVSAYRVSKETGINQQTFSKWKKGISSPKTDKLQKIADYFGVSVDYLIGSSHSDDTEFQDYLEELRTRPEMKMLFSVTKNASKEDVEKAVKIIETMLGK